MTTARQAAEASTTALENHDTNAVRATLAANFMFDDPSSPAGPVNADQWLYLTDMMFRAFPDFSYNFVIEGEEGNQVWVSTQFQGTHTGDWDLSAMGMGVIPASGKSFLVSRSMSRGTVNKAGKIERIEVTEQDDNGGLPGMLRQLGVNLG